MRASTQAASLLRRLAACVIDGQHARPHRRLCLSPTLQLPLLHSRRRASTLTSLVRVQTALQEQQQQQHKKKAGKRVTCSSSSSSTDGDVKAAASDYAAFFHIPVAKGASVAQSMREHYARVQQQAARQLNSGLARLQQQQEPPSCDENGVPVRGAAAATTTIAAAAAMYAAHACDDGGGGGGAAALLLAGFDAEHDAMALYAPATDAIVTVPCTLMPTSNDGSRADEASNSSSSGSSSGSGSNADVGSSTTRSGMDACGVGSSDESGWQLASELMRCTRGATQVTVVPIVESAQERARVQGRLTTLTHAMRASGLLPVAHVDTLELATSLTCSDGDDSGGGSSSSSPSPPRLRDVIASAATLRDRAPAPLSHKWFRAHWVYVRLLACKRADADPFVVVRELIVPSYDVLVLHLVRAGTRSLNLSAWDVTRRRRYAAKGLLSDILACLLSTHARRLILVPTNRTDRAALFRCRTALQKSGHSCVVVFASEVDTRCRTAYQSEPYRYWRTLRTLTSGSGSGSGSGSDAELLVRVRAAAGNTLRAYHKKTLHTDGTRLLQYAAAAAAAKRKRATSAAATDDDNNNKRTSDDDNDDDTATALTTTSTDVAEWLRVFALPSRQRAEADERQHYTRYLVVAYTATEHVAYGQPANPVSRLNYVICVCLRDHTGQQLEPVSKYTARGQFALPSLRDYDVLIAHDAKRLLLLAYDDAELQQFLRRGGRVWCTMLAEYLLDAQRCRTGQNSVRDVCMRHHVLLPACSVLGVANERLPLSFHATFLTQAAPALARVADAQLQRAVAQCQLLSLAHRMDALLAMTAMEWAGIYVDTREAAAQSRALHNAATALDAALGAFVPPELPADLRDSFDWASSQHLHAYFFGGLLTLVAVGDGDGTGGGGGSGAGGVYGMRARDSATWTAHLIYLCYRYGGPLSAFANELHLQRYAAQCRLSATGVRLTQRVAQHLEHELQLLPTAVSKRHNNNNNNNNNNNTSSSSRNDDDDKSDSSSRSDGGGVRFRLLLIDVESTGLNPATDRIVELALYDPVEQSSFTTLVNPQRRITPRTIEIHHITDDDVRHAPTLEAVMPRLVQYLRLDRRPARGTRAEEVVVLVGHNVFTLDEPMLRRAFALYAPDVAYDGILYCDSIVLLRALKSQLRSDAASTSSSSSTSSSRVRRDKDDSSRRTSSDVVVAVTPRPRRLDRGLLETLTSSLRLSDLVAKLNITTPGQLHRAEADTKALWFVLVNAFGLTGCGVQEQCDAVLAAAARTLLAFPATGCFVPLQRRRCALHVRLAGVVHDATPRVTATTTTGDEGDAAAADDTTRTSRGVKASATNSKSKSKNKSNKSSGISSATTARLIRSLQSQPFSDRVLEALDRHFDLPVVAMLLQRRRLDMHTARFLHASRDGALTTLHRDDQCVHQHIDLTATTTSRTTSAYPSCQNIPKDDKSSVRRLFASRFGDRGRCVEVDYAQLEIVVLANLCHDAQLTRDLNSGVDFHVKRAAFFSGQSYAQIHDGYLRGDAAATRLRRTAKQFSFQRLYGAGVSLLHKTTGIAVRDLHASIAREEREYPAIARFHRRVRAVALRARNPGLPTHFLFELPTGARMHFRTRDVLLNLPPVKNYPIQGYGAELAQMMVGRLYRHFAQHDFYGQRAFLVNFVHDSVWLDCHVDVLSQCVRDTCAILSDVHTYVPRTFPGVRITVPLHVTAACGTTMATLQRLDAAATTTTTTPATAAAVSATTRTAASDNDDSDDGDDVATTTRTQQRRRRAVARVRRTRASSPRRKKTTTATDKHAAVATRDDDADADADDADADGNDDDDVA